MLSRAPSLTRDDRRAGDGADHVDRHRTGQAVTPPLAPSAARESTRVAATPWTTPGRQRTAT